MIWTIYGWGNIKYMFMTICGSHLESELRRDQMGQEF